MPTTNPAGCSATNRLLKREAVLAIAFIVRLILIAWGDFQDRHYRVRYTDVDYAVYSDAADFMASGESPYLRHTFRYTPLLGALLIPNFWLAIFGKIVFCVADLCVAWLIIRHLERSGVAPNTASAWSCVWLFNPVTLTVSSRGNADALIVLSILAMIDFAERNRISWAAILFGVSIHLKLYPIIYSLALLLRVGSPEKGRASIQANPVSRIWARLSSLRAITFSTIAAVTFITATAGLYMLYGWEFLYETYLYHLIRRDNRHNFSLHFYHIYLGFEDHDPSLLQSVLNLLPQALLCLVLSLKLHSHHSIILCLFLCTHTFVMYNKVVTAQYFIWYFVFLPMVLPQTTIARKDFLCGLILLWAFTQGFWLSCGYQVEFKGLPAFYTMWFASLSFFICNAMVSFALIRSWDPSLSKSKRD